MPALRETILARMAAALVAATPAGSNVYRSREVSITKQMVPAITVLFDGEDSQRIGHFTLRHQLTVLCAIFVRGDPWDQLAATVDEAMHRTLLADETLRQLVTDIVRTGADPEAEEADRTAGTLSVRYRIDYLTSASDIAALPQ